MPELHPPPASLSTERGAAAPLQGLLKCLAIGLICLMQMSLSYLQMSQIMDHQKDSIEMIDFPTDVRGFYKSNARCPHSAAQPVGLAQIPGDIRPCHALLREILKSQT